MSGHPEIIGLLSFILVFIVLWAVVWAVLIGMSYNKSSSPFDNKTTATFPFVVGGTTAAPAVAPVVAPAVTPAPALSPNDNDITFVFVYAPWCRGCKMNRPMWEAWRNSTSGRRMNTAEVNGDEHRDFIDTFGITVYPTLIAARNGKKISTYTETGMDAAKIQEWAEHVSRSRF